MTDFIEFVFALPRSFFGFVKQGGNLLRTLRADMIAAQADNRDLISCPPCSAGSSVDAKHFEKHQGVPARALFTFTIELKKGKVKGTGGFAPPGRLQNQRLWKRGLVLGL